MAQTVLCIPQTPFISSLGTSEHYITSVPWSWSGNKGLGSDQWDVGRNSVYHLSVALRPCVFYTLSLLLTQLEVKVSAQRHHVIQTPQSLGCPFREPYREACSACIGLWSRGNKHWKQIFIWELLLLCKFGRLFMIFSYRKVVSRPLVSRLGNGNSNGTLFFACSVSSTLSSECNPPFPFSSTSIFLNFNPHGSESKTTTHPQLQDLSAYPSPTSAKWEACVGTSCWN